MSGRRLRIISDAKQGSDANSRLGELKRRGKRVEKNFWSPHKRLLIKIIPHHTSVVYKLELSHLHLGVAAGCAALLVAALLVGHVGALRSAQAEVRKLQAVTAAQNRQLAAFSQQTRVMWSRLTELQKQNREIRRLTGIGVPEPAPAEKAARAAATSPGAAVRRASVAAMGGAPDGKADARTQGLALWSRLRSLLQDGDAAFASEARQIDMLNRESARALADAMVLKARAKISADAKREASLARQRFLDAIPSIWPTNGYVSSGFGYRTYPDVGFHAGLDIVNDYGAPVYATASGVVVEAGWDGGYGYKIVIDHGNGYETWYGHNSRLLVSAGQEVHKGEEIARVGATGFATGTHVHYELLQWGRPIDPTRYLNGIPAEIAASQ